ncbi:hypothetical protein FJTKL_03473 [Diaporthe vaccinii]|uniref:Uncharacterized protein n=1 Tax=Diaporthe vaccinii TaxID=105482 RepID=A0ABR4F2B4_9PEZI
MSECDPTKIPLSVAPPGQSNDVTGGPSQAWMPRLAIYTTLPVAVGFVLSRIYARLKFRIAFGWDDGLCLAAMRWLLWCDVVNRY